MELRHLRYFVTVAEELHFGRAAQRLNISQPPLSRQIQELEEELGFALFVREYHKVELTEAGKVYLAQVKGILGQLGLAQQDAAAVALGRQGHLRIGSGVHLPEGYLPRLLAAFSATRQAGLDILEAPSPRMVQALLDKTIDVAFVMLPLTRSGLLVKELMREPLMIVLPVGHRLAGAPLHSLAQLADENWVTCRRYEEPGYRELVESLCARAGFTPRVRQAVEHRQTTLDLVAEGLGVSIVPWSELAASDRLAYLAFPGSTPFCETGLAWREDTPVASSIAALVDIAEREAATFAAAIPGQGDDVAAWVPRGVRLTA